MTSESNNRRIPVYLLIFALLGAFIGTCIGFAYYGPKWIRGPKHHCTTNESTRKEQLVTPHPGRIVFLSLNGHPATNYELYIDYVDDNQMPHLHTHLRVADGGTPDAVLLVPGSISKITQILICPRNSETPIASYMPTPDGYWADDQMGEFFISWSPASQAVVIMDANLNSPIFNLNQ